MLSLTDVSVKLSSPDAVASVGVRGDVDYYHYGCDGFDDRVRDMRIGIFSFLGSKPCGHTSHV